MEKDKVKGRHKNTRQHKSDIIKLYVEGKSVREIGAIYNVSKNIVSKLIKEDMPLRSKSTVESLKEDMYVMYKGGYNFNQIGKHFNVNSSSVARLLRKYYDDVDKGKRKYGHLVEDFKRDYKGGMSLYEIGKKYGVSRQVVLDYLDSEKEEVRYYSETSRKYFLDENYFDVLNDKKAYQLGLFFAMCTLNIVLNKHLDLSISGTKVGLIREALDGLTSKVDEDAIYFYAKENIAKVRLNSEKLYDVLDYYGLRSGKVNIPKKYKKSFFEGYFKVRLNISDKVLSIGFNSYKDFILDYLVYDLGISLSAMQIKKSNVIIQRMNVVSIVEKHHPMVRVKINNYLAKNKDNKKWKSYVCKYGE